MDGVLDGLHGVIDFVRDGARQLTCGGEFLDFEHAPLHLQLLELSPGGEIAQHGYRVRNLATHIINFSGTRGIFHFGLGSRIEDAQGAVILVGKGKGESSQISIELGQIFHHLRMLGALGDSKQLFGQRIEEHDFRRIIGDDDGISDVFNDQIEAVSFLAHDLFGNAQFLQIGAHFHICAPQIGDVAHHRDHAGSRSVRALRGRAHRLEENFLALHHIHQRKISRSICSAHHHGGERSRKQQIVEFHGAASAIADAFRHAEKPFRGAVLNHHAVLVVRKNHGVRHALHDRAEPRDGYFHIAHAVEVVLDLEQSRQVIIGPLGKVAELFQTA